MILPVLQRHRGLPTLWRFMNLMTIIIIIIIIRKIKKQYLLLEQLFATNIDSYLMFVCIFQKNRLVVFWPGRFLYQNSTIKIYNIHF